MKHRAAVVGLALVAGGAVLWLGDHLMSATATPPSDAMQTARQTVGRTAERVEPPGVKAATPTAPVAPASTEGGTFTGRVLDAVTREPVREFMVALRDASRWESRWREPYAAQTFRSPDGRFAWQRAPVGNWDVTIAATGYQRFEIDNIAIAAGKASQEIVVRMRRGQYLKGRVFDQISGAGLGDAHVSLRDPQWSAAQPEVIDDTRRTRADGTFEFDGVAEGETIVRVVAKDHAPREVLTVVRDETPPVEIGLLTGGRIAGMVVAANGTPASGTIVLGGPDVPIVNKLDATGAFAFEHRSAGRYRLSAHTGTGNASLDLELAENEIREGVVLTVGVGGRTVRGVVTGLRPEQLQRTSISVHSVADPSGLITTPDAQGAYAFAGVPPGRTRLIVDVEMSRRLYRNMVVPADEDVVLNIVIAPGVSLAGRVTQDGKPAANRIVRVGSRDGRLETAYQGRTGQDGRYEIEGVAPGEYRVSVPEGTSQVVAIAGDTVLNFDLPLVQLSGRVVEDGSTDPVVGAAVHVSGLEPDTALVRSYKQSDHFGRFNLLGMEPGEVLLTVFKPGYELHREKIPFSAPITSKTITLRKSDGVEVRVQFAAGNAKVRRLFVQEQLQDNVFGIGTSIALDRDGIGSLPAGLAGSTLHIHHPDGGSIVVEKWDGQSLDLKL